MHQIAVLSLFVLGAASTMAQTNACPNNAVFLGVENQVRGYSLRSNGAAAPCQVIAGSNTILGSARSITVSKNGFLHVAQFLTNGTVNVFAPDANGNATPTRTVSVLTNDLAGIATDSKVNDYVLSVRGQPVIIVFPSSANGQLQNPVSFTIPNLSHVATIAMGTDDNLIVGGYDKNGNAELDTFATSQDPTAPALLRRLSGPATGLYAGSTNPYHGNGFSAAIDPETGELYVYNTTLDGHGVQVSVFAAGASGNAAPLRVISGSNTGIGQPGYLGANKIAVASDGRLFVSEQNNKVLVFAPGANGDTAPAQTIQDTTPGAETNVGGIAVRSCRCQ